MARFIVNRNPQSTGEHEVHNLDANPRCGHLPDLENQLPLGDHPNCQSAIRAAKLKYSLTNVDGCAYCCPECHSR